MNTIYTIMLIIGIVGLIITEILCHIQFTKEIKKKDTEKWHKWKLRF